MIRVTEYWPTFVDRDLNERRITVVEDEPDIMLIPWIADKIGKDGWEITWDTDKRFLGSGHVMHLWDDGRRWIIANLKSL